MSLFKYKPPKKIVLDERSITTLDSKHKELQSDFQYIQDTIIPGLENERNMLKERLNLLKGVPLGVPPGVPPPRDGNYVRVWVGGGVVGGVVVGGVGERRCHFFQASKVDVCSISNNIVFECESRTGCGGCCGVAF